jgi:hypothetical protein
MRLDICGTIRGEGRAACGQVLRLLHDRTEKMRPARRLQMNCVDERRISSEGIPISKCMSLSAHRPPASWLSIVVVGYAMAAVMVVLLWAGFARRLILMPHAPKPYPEVRHCRPDDE